MDDIEIAMVGVLVFFMASGGLLALKSGLAVSVVVGAAASAVVVAALVAVGEG